MNRDTSRGACPDPQMLSAYLDGKLDPTERGRIEDHISRCEDCYFVVRETALVWAEAGAEGTPPAGTERETPGGGEVVQATFGGDAATPAASAAVEVPAADPRRPKASSFARYFMPIAATLVVAAGALALWKQSRVTDPYAETVRPLVEALGPRRLSEPRLVGGFQPGPLVQPRRSPRGVTDDWGLLAAAAALKEKAASSSSPVDLQALAAAHLLLGEADEAIAILEELIIGSPSSAQLRSDLAAGYLIRARMAARPTDIPRALDNAVLAVQLDSSLREAKFNLALARAESGLVQEALALLEELTREMSPRDPWREAVDSKMAELRDVLRPVAPSASDAGVLFERFEREIAKFATADRRTSDPRVALAEAMDLGTSYGLATGEDLGALLRSSLEGRPPHSLSEWLEFSRARTLYEANRISEAEPLFRSLAATRNETPLVGWASLHAAIASYWKSDFVEAEERLGLLTRTASRRGWQRLWARAHWVQGLMAGVQGRYLEAEGHYATSRLAFRSVGDLAGESSVLSLLGEVNALLGRTHESWLIRIESIQKLRDARDWRKEETALLLATLQAADLRLPQAALEFQQRAELVARRSGDTAGLAESLLYGAEVRNRFALASGPDLDAIRDLAERSDGALRSRLRAEVAIRSPLSDARSLATTQKGLEEAAVYFSASGSRKQHDKLAQVALRTGMLLRTRGERAAALGKFNEAISVLTTLSQPMSASQRILLVETAGQAVQEMLDPASGLSTLQMLELIDRFHCLSFDRQERCLSPRRFARGLAVLSKDCLVQMVPLRSEVLTIVAGTGGNVVTRSPVPLSQIQSAIRYALGQLSGGGGGSEKSNQAFARLSKLVLAGVRVPDSCERLYFQPLRELAEVPTGLWFLPGEGSPVLSTRVVATLAALSERQPAASHRSPRPWIAVAQPAPIGFDHLPLTKRELETLAAVRPTRVIAGPLTENEFSFLLAQAGVLHFAGHAVADPRDPLGSYLVLQAKEGEPAARARASALYELSLSGSTLVFLSACEAAGGGRDSVHPGASLAKAFITAGAGHVIAPVAAIRDGAPHPLAASFYRRLNAGADPAEALALAQRELLSSEKVDPSLLSFQTLVRSLPHRSHQDNLT